MKSSITKKPTTVNNRENDITQPQSIESAIAGDEIIQVKRSDYECLLKEMVFYKKTVSELRERLFRIGGALIQIQSTVYDVNNDMKVIQ